MNQIVISYISYIFSGFLIFIYQTAWAQSKVVENLAMGLGELKRIYLSAPINIELGSEFKYHVGSRDQNGKVELSITSLKPGYGLVKGKNKVIAIHALTLKQLRTWEALTQYVKDKFYLNVGLEQGEVVLRGDLIRFNLVNELKHICSIQECDFSNRIKVAPHQQKVLRHLIYKAIQYELDEILEINFYQYWQARISNSQKKKNKYQKIIKVLSNFGIKINLDDETLEVKPSIKVHMLFLELKKHYMKQLGINFPTEVSAQILPNYVLDPAYIKASFFEQEGWGRTIASPSLILRSGDTGEFRAGGEIPIRQIAFRTATVEWKNYGVFLKIKAQGDLSGRLNIDVDCEISSVDSSIQIDGVPGFKMHRLRTSFDLIKSQVIILSGLIQRDQMEAAQGLQGIKNLPIIGHFFSSSEYRNKESEFIIFIKPEVLEIY